MRSTDLRDSVDEQCIADIAVCIITGQMLWLALQLANEGYRVWCDLTKLLGGEVFWDNIEEVIKSRAVKVLYVLSRTSNAKDGPLKELHFAQGVAKREKLKDFVIPLHIDDLPHGDITIEITRINAVPCAKSWGAVNRVKALYRSWGIACEGQQVYAPRHRAHFVDRTLQLELLRNTLAAEPTVFLLYGEPGSGKSTLTLQLAWEAQKDFDAVVF